MNSNGLPQISLGRFAGVASDRDVQQTRSNTAANSTPNNYINDSPAISRSPALPSHGAVLIEDWDAGQQGGSVVGDHAPSRPQSVFSADGSDPTLARRNTLKKKASLRRNGGLNRNNSRRSMHAGSVKSLVLEPNIDPDELHSVFHCPVPTAAHPTEALANRFQGWRKILKDLLLYLRELYSFNEQRVKSSLKLSNVVDGMIAPAGFMNSDGMEDGFNILRLYHKSIVAEGQKAQEVAQDVIISLTGLRNDLQQKIKEIRNLAGDFKNSVEKEMESTRRVVKTLQAVLGQNEMDTASTLGSQDPYLLKLAVDRQVWRQVAEENYLHQAYLNLENSGRELESIVVGEIQKSYNAFAGILKREADAAYNSMEMLRTGPITMPKDLEWTSFVQNNSDFVDTGVTIRSADLLHYPGQNHPSCQEVRAGLLERKSKYLKSYTAGWFVLSPTHLHEFKSADKGQAPVMSLYLPDQRLGSHSAEGSSSNKFVVKGRQTGALHIGHTWVFRAESHDTMMAWYEDIKLLTETSAEERTSLLRGRARSLSQSSRYSMSSDGIQDDEGDEAPFLAATAIDTTPGPLRQDVMARRPQPGGRFPSDLPVNTQRGLQVPQSPYSVSSGGFGAAPGARAAQVQGPSVNGQVDAQGGAQHDAQRDLQREWDGGRSQGDYFDHQAGPSQAAHGADSKWTREGHGYGDTNGALMEDVPSRAAAAGQNAREDGLNPYREDAIGGAGGVLGLRTPSVETWDMPSSLQATDSDSGTAAECLMSGTEPGHEFLTVWTGKRGRRGDGDGVEELDQRMQRHGLVSGMTTGTSPSSTGIDNMENTDKTTRARVEARDDSVATICNLPIPGKFPRAESPSRD